MASPDLKEVRQPKKQYCSYSREQLKEMDLEELNKAVPHRWKSFVYCYVENGFNAAAAARECGYDSGYGSELKEKDPCQVLIKRILEQKALTAEEVLAELAHMATDREGKYSSREKFKALKYLGDTYQMVQSKTEIVHKTEDANAEKEMDVILGLDSVEDEEEDEKVKKLEA